MSMNEIGYYSTFIALSLALWGCVTALVSCSSGDKRYRTSAARSLYGVFVLLIVSTVLLCAALLRDDFTLKYVYQYSKRSQPWVYKLSALWGGMDGSLLLWCLLLAFFSVLVALMNRRRNSAAPPFTLFLLLLTLAFFLYLIFFQANPFTPMVDEFGRLVSSYPRAELARIDGNGLNPLLQNPYMAIHPPALYLGYVGFAIPFALFLGGLFHRTMDNALLRSVRRWSLFSWLTLGVGILLGSYWAYIELGWGGYWGWDPVENASLVPWITGTALLHALLMVEKRGIFRRWSAFFVVSTFLLTIYGTYLTRSGVLQSVHAFGQENSATPWYLKLGTLFLLFMAVMLSVSLFLVITRRRELRGTEPVESAGSKESIFIYSSLIFSLLAGIVLFGLTDPIFVRLFTGKEPSLGPEFYVSKVAPVALLLLLVMGIAPLAPWRTAGWKRYRSQLPLPFTAAVAALAGSFASVYFFAPRAGVIQSMKPITVFYLLACVTLAAFAVAVSFEEYARMAAYALRSGRSRALSVLLAPMRENPRRYGSYVIHLGIVCFFLGAAFSSVFSTRYQEYMRPGDSVRVGPYTVRMEKISHDDLNADLNKVNQVAVWTNLQVFSGARYLTTLDPKRVFYASNPEQPSYEVALRSSLARDFYTVILSFDLKKNSAVIGFFVNSMIGFLWLGGLLILIGGLLAFLPTGRR